MYELFRRKIDSKNQVIFKGAGAPDVLEYAGSGSQKFYQEFYDKGFEALIGTRTRQFRIVLSKILPAIQPDASVLDVGCGNGLFLELAKAASPEINVVGIDPGSNARKIYIKKVDFFQFKSKKLDLITFFDVFEHFQNPQDVLKKIRSLLAPNGQLILKVPSKTSLIYRVARLLLRFNIGLAKPVMARLYQVDFPPPHFFFYDFASLKELLASEGFVIHNRYYLSEIFLREIFNRTWSLKGLGKVFAMIGLTAVYLLSFFSLKDSVVVHATFEGKA